MMNYIDLNRNIKYTFIPDNKNFVWLNTALNNNLECIFRNDIYEKYTTLANVYGELVICKDLSKADTFCKKMIPETYQEYLDFISKRNFNKEQWVYNILDGKAEQDKILYRDDKIVVIPNYTWDCKDMSKMYLLVFPIDRSLKSLRDLNEKHIELLEHCKNKTLEIIKNHYGFDKNDIKMFFHYSPSTYHLHIHFVLISNTECNSSVEYSHELSNVIFNLSIKSDYYQSIIMNKRI